MANKPIGVQADGANEQATATTDPLTGRITSLRYKRLVNLGNYENEDLSATIEVRDGDDPDEALAALKGWVRRRTGQQREIEGLESRARSAESRLREARQSLETMQERWKVYRAFLLQHGIPEAELPREPYWGATHAEMIGPDDDEEDERY